MTEYLYPFLILWGLWAPYILLVSRFDHSWRAFLFAVILISATNVFVSWQYSPLAYTVAIGFGLSPWVFLLYRFFYHKDKIKKVAKKKIVGRRLNNYGDECFKVLISRESCGRFDVAKLMCRHSGKNKPIISLKAMNSMFEGFSVSTKQNDNYSTVREFERSGLLFSMYFSRKTDKDLVELNSFYVSICRMPNETECSLLEKIMKEYNYHIYHKRSETFYSDIKSLKEAIEEYLKK